MSDTNPTDVVIGVDTHKNVHAVAAVSALGVHLASTTIPYASGQPRLLGNDEFWQGNTLRSALRWFKVMADGAVEIITGRERRRRWSIEDKLKIVAETLEPGASVNQIAARHDVYPGLLFTWRRQMRSGKLAAQRKPLFFHVQTHDAGLSAVPAQMQRASSASRQIEIELSNGSRVRVEEGVSLTALRRVLAALRE